MSGGGAGSSSWSSLTAPSANLTLGMSSFTTTFNHASAVNWKWANTTAATSGTSQSSPIVNLSGQYWNGSASAEDKWTIQDVVSNGTNGASILTFTHSGSSGQAALDIPAGAVQLPSLRFAGNQIGFWAQSATILQAQLGTSIQGEFVFQVGSTIGFHFTHNTSSGNCAVNGGTTASPFAVFGNSITSGREALALGGPQLGNTSGTMICVAVGNYSTLNNAFCQFGPTSGTANFQAFSVHPTLNQTGGANGTMTSIMVNAIETAIVGTHNFLDLQGGSGGTTSKFTIKNSGAITNYNAEATAGPGVAYIRGQTSQKAETGADASVLSVTPAAAAGTYRIVIVMSVSAASAATLGWTATWTDSNGTAQAPTNLALTKSGTAAPALTFAAAANDAYYAEAIVDVNNAGTAIVVKTTFSGTSIAYKVTATIERIA